MVINATVQYSGGFLPEIILLTLPGYVITLGNMKSFCPYSQCSHNLNLLIAQEV